MSKPVILLDAGQLVGLSGAADGDVLTWNGTLNQWQSSPGGGVGTVTSVALDTASTGLTVSGGTSQTITGSGTFTLGGTLGAGYGGTGLGAPVSGDAGKVLAATAGGGYELVTNGNGTVTSVTAGTGLSGGTITTSGTISMPNVGTSGAYGSASSVPVITTDAQGRVSSVTPTAIAIAQSAVTDLVSDLAGKVPTSTQVIAGTGLSGGGALSSNVTLSLPSVGTQGTYGSASSVAVITTDQQGRVSGATTTAIAITQSQVADLVTDLGLKADKSVTATAGTGLTGGGTLGANFSFALDTVGTAASNQGSASKTVTISTDAYGRVTSLTEQAISGLPASVISSGQLALARGGTGIDASGVTGGQLLVGGTGALALQSLSQDGSLAPTGALTVTGLQTNPVASGTLGLPDAGKALVWSGSAWQATNIQGGGGGGGLTFYMNYAASSPYPLATQFDQVAGWDTGAITVDNTTAGTALGTFVTATNTPAVEVIPAGIWEVNFYAESNAPSNGVAVRAKVATLAGATQTVLATSDWVYLSDPTVVTPYTASVYVPLTDTSLTDRVEIIFEGRRFGATAYTVTLHFGTDSISHVHTTINAPGGTGLLKVVNGYLQSPASLLVNADVSDTAAIAVSKLAAGTNGYLLTTVGGVPTWSAAPATGVTSILGTANQVIASSPTGAVTLSLPQSIGTGNSPTFAGLTVSGLTNGIVKATSGLLSGGNSVSLTSEVTGTLPILNGGTNLTSSGASGNLLVSDGSAWASVPMTGDATIVSTGALTLKNTGSAGTYGSASAVPVFDTDAQGRVTSVTNTSIAIAASAVTSGQLAIARGGTGAASTSQSYAFIGPTSGSGAPSFRALTSADISDLSSSAVTSLTGGTGVSVSPGTTGALTVAIGQSVATSASPTFAGLTLTSFSGLIRATGGSLAGGASVALGSEVSGTLGVGNGGTGAATTSQNFVFAGPTSGSGAPSFRALVAGDIPSLSSTYLPLSGGTLTGKLITVASALGSAGFNLPHGAAPTSAVNGDLWTTFSGLFVQIGGSTQTIPTISNSNNWSGTNSFTGATNNFGLAASTSTTGLATGATINGQTKTVSIGTGGVAGSTTTITIGATAGTSTTTLNGSVAIANLTGYVKGNGVSAMTASATVPTSDLSGQVALTNGGTNASLTAAAGAVAYSTASALGLSAVGTSGQVLKSNGTSAPSWTDMPYDLSGEFVGTPASGATIMRFVAARAFTLTGTARFAVTSNTGATTATFTVNHVSGGVTTAKGAVTILGNATTGSGSLTTTSVAVGDYITVVATTPANVIDAWWTLPGTV